MAVKARLCASWFVQARKGSQGLERKGASSFVMVRFGSLGDVWQGKATLGPVRNGMDWQSRNVSAGIGQSTFGLDRPGMAVEEWYVKFGNGMACYGSQGWARHDMDRCRLEWQSRIGESRHGSVSCGMAVLVRIGSSGFVKAWNRVVRQSWCAVASSGRSEIGCVRLGSRGL